MKKNKISQVKIGALISYLALGVNILTGLIYTPWMVDVIGQSNYGLYTLATSIISIFMLDFGLGSAVSRFVSKYRAEGNLDGVNKITGIIYKLYIAIDIVILTVLTVLFFFLDVIYVKLTPSELDQFKTLYLMVAAFNIISFPFAPVSGILNSYEKFIQLKICDLFNKIFTVTCVVVALRFSNSVTTVIAANVISGLITVFAKFIIMKATVPIQTDFKAKGKELYKNLFSFTAWTTIISIMQRFTHSLAPSVLAITSSSIEIAVYAPAVTVEGYYYLLANAVNGMFLPRVSKYIADKEEEKILPLMIKVGRYQILFLGLAFIGFVCLGKDFMILWMGPEYIKTYYCAMIILFPTLISASMQIAGTTMIAKNMINYQAMCMIVTGTVGLVISYVLSIFLGSVGVCIGTAVTALANIVFNNYIYKTKVGINIFEFYKKCYLRAIPCYAITIVIGLIVAHLITISGWIGFLIKVLLIVIVFVSLCFVIYLSSDERKQIINKIRIRK